jgi:UDP-N-acetylmuramoyl-tripeptide--D-alanyl-D-alanine ligase
VIDLKISEIINALNGEMLQGDKNILINGISTDSRTIKKGELFIPLKGNNYDGERFLEDALKIAAAALTANEKNKKLIMYDKPLIYVRDTFEALHKLSRYYRDKFNIPVIAVTGSSGKTTTKDMIHAVLSKKFNVLKTEGNFNNEIGLPLTIFKLNKFHQAAVIEMGMSGFGEIKTLKDISNPDIAVFTNIGVAHIEKLSSRENILKAKSELIEDFTTENTIVINADDDMLIKLLNKKDVQFYTYGIRNGDYRAYDIIQFEGGLRYKFKTPFESMNVELSIPGIHNVYNSMAAICIGLKFNVKKEDIVKALREFKPGKMRLNIINTGKIKIIDDVYNANPDSMKAAISVLREMKQRRKIAVLGDMLELGDYSDKGHKEIGEYVYISGIDILITIGNLAEKIAKAAQNSGMAKDNIYICSSNTEAIDILKGKIRNNDVILVKGSRGKKMEEIVEYLKDDYERIT